MSSDRLRKGQEARHAAFVSEVPDLNWRPLP